MSFLDFTGVKKLLGDAGAIMRSKREELERLRRERDVVAAAPLAKADVIQALHRRIDQEGARHMAIFADSLRPKVISGNPDRVAETPILAASRPDTLQSPIGMEAAVCLVMGEQMKVAAVRIVEGMEWPAHAMDHSAKTERLAKLDSRIAALESEVAAMVRDARAAGLNI